MKHMSDLSKLVAWIGYQTVSEPVWRRFYPPNVLYLSYTYRQPSSIMEIGTGVNGQTVTNAKIRLYDVGAASRSENLLQRFYIPAIRA